MLPPLNDLRMKIRELAHADEPAVVEQLLAASSLTEQCRLPLTLWNRAFAAMQKMQVCFRKLGVDSFGSATILGLSKHRNRNTE